MEKCTNVTIKEVMYTLSKHVARLTPSHPSPERRLPLEAVILRGCHAGPASDNESEIKIKIKVRIQC